MMERSPQFADSSPMVMLAIILLVGSGRHAHINHLGAHWRQLVAPRTRLHMQDKFSRADLLGGLVNIAAVAAVKPNVAEARSEEIGFLWDAKRREEIHPVPFTSLVGEFRDMRRGPPRVIFVAETHDNMAHHNLQLEVIKAVEMLGMQDQVPTLIGMEMFWRQHQPALDAFVFGRVDEGGGSISKLAERTEWSVNWGYPLELYSDIFQFARQRRIRLCGLNVPYPVIRQVGKSGLDSLDAETRNLLPNLDLENEDHYRRFVDQMQAFIDSGEKEPVSEQKLNFSYQALTLWDEYMASSIGGYVWPTPRDGIGPRGETSTGKERMVVLVGSSHVQGRVGIPDRYKRRSGIDSLTILPVDIPYSSEDAVPPSEADWILYKAADGI